MYTSDGVYPDVNAGEDFIPSDPSFPVFAAIASNDTGTLDGGSYGDEGFLTSVTQKHLAIPSSPLTSDMLKPKSVRFFMEPRRLMGFCEVFELMGGEMSWLIWSNACCKSCRAVRLNIVSEQSSCFE